MRRDRWVLAAVIAAGLPLMACTRTPAEPAGDPPATVERVSGSAQARVTLTSEAARHLGVETVPVRAARQGEGPALLVPYAAVLYDPAGRTWVYTSPEQLVYVRQAIRVEDIRGDWALLRTGPPAGMRVVTVGASELLGVEYEVGEE